MADEQVKEKVHRMLVIEKKDSKTMRFFLYIFWIFTVIGGGGLIYGSATYLTIQMSNYSANGLSLTLFNLGLSIVVFDLGIKIFDYAWKNTMR